ncbi:uncharacterized protein LOC108594913 [Drosophila busckii]|uniref:uncharacterized protein LOC108594913 n=1 Tax=Drosophila busckii TaxID=30019 RepID=UPI00083F0451|nr:uncharacterized protein LOC108594913 [Drosophila busckii]
MIFELIKSLFVLLVLFQHCICKPQWEYEPISIVSQTSDPNKLNLESEVVRINRGEYAFSGELFWNFDADETTMVESMGYRSNTGNEEDYKLLPMGIPKQTYQEYLENFYEKMLYLNVKNCSKLPEPENAWPWARGTYTFKNCVATGDGLPDVTPEGYYKVVFMVTGEVEWNMTSIVKVTTKVNLYG